MSKINTTYRFSRDKETPQGWMRDSKVRTASTDALNVLKEWRSGHVGRAFEPKEDLPESLVANVVFDVSDQESARDDMLNLCRDWGLKRDTLDR